MKKYRLTSLPDNREGHFLKGIIPGNHINGGGMGFKKPGQRTHSFDGPEGRDWHVHDDEYEVFVILGGKAVLEVKGEKHPMVTGDVFVVEPGEDHHLVADAEDPCVNLFLHAGNSRSEVQEG
ncbi:MAG: cupin domain-containing protein [Chitinivibrionales bacterium]|nr:cupin domain-containing protein [Chitinivibrionales bacterium]